MANYVKSIPRDVGGEPLQEFPAPYESLATYQVENAAISSAISFNPNTTSLEVGTFGGQGAVIRWVSVGETASVAPRASVVASGAGANFDHWIPTGTYRKFAVPKETIGQMAGGQIGSVNGLFQRVAVINGGATAASVLLTEF